jgi:hypothetical protein
VRILQALLAASKPLSLGQMNVVLSVQPDSRSVEDLIPHLAHSIERTIKYHCGHFIKVIDSKVLFIHQTARKFLLHLPDGDAFTLHWKYKLHFGECRLFLAARFIWYLLLDENKIIGYAASGDNETTCSNSSSEFRSKEVRGGETDK